MSEKTPGQIAFEANAEWHGYTGRFSRWESASPADLAKWDFIGQKVAQAVSPVPEP